MHTSSRAWYGRLIALRQVKARTILSVPAQGVAGSFGEAALSSLYDIVHHGIRVLGPRWWLRGRGWTGQWTVTERSCGVHSRRRCHHLSHPFRCQLPCSVRLPGMRDTYDERGRENM